MTTQWIKQWNHSADLDKTSVWGNNNVGNLRTATTASSVILSAFNSRAPRRKVQHVIHRNKDRSCGGRKKEKYIVADYGSDAWRAQIKRKAQLPWWQRPPNNIFNTRWVTTRTTARAFDCDGASFGWRMLSFKAQCVDRKWGNSSSRVEVPVLRERGLSVCPYEENIQHERHTTLWRFLELHLKSLGHPQTPAACRYVATHTTETETDWTHGRRRDSNTHMSLTHITNSALSVHFTHFNWIV